jgi:hypothetical protein
MRVSLPGPDDKEPEHEPLTDEQIAELELSAAIEPELAKFISGVLSELKDSLIEARAKAREAHGHYADVLRHLGTAVEGRGRYVMPMKKIRELREQSKKSMNDFDQALVGLVRDFQ